jgi:hypothetical protein
MEDISVDLKKLASVVSALPPTPLLTEELSSIYTPIPVTLIKNHKFQAICKLTGLCHVVIRVDTSQDPHWMNAMFNWQKIDHVWSSCRQLPRCPWSGDSYLHMTSHVREKRDNTTPNCCTCRLKDGQHHHPANYQGCSKHRRGKAAQEDPEVHQQRSNRQDV